MVWPRLLLPSLLIFHCVGARVHFRNQVNVVRVLSWRDSLQRVEEAGWTCQIIESVVEEGCVGEGIENVEAFRDQLVDREGDWKIRKVEGSVLFGKFHGKINIHLDRRRLIYVKMCLGVVCGPFQVYEGFKLVKVVSDMGIWVFDSKVVRAASFVKNEAEVTFIIFEQEEDVIDYVIFGKLEGDTFYEAMLENVEITDKFAKPVYRLKTDTKLFNSSSISKHKDNTNFWYKYAKAIISLNKSMEVNVKKRQIFENRCPTSITKYVSKYGLSEQSFISSKVTPNLPSNMSTSLNCSDIFKTVPDYERNRTGFVSFPGSGALWIR